jgi:hypothetical protein
MSLTRKRQRISLAMEQRIWQLRCQGYDLDTLGRIVNAHPGTCAHAVYRARLHWKYQGDPRLGRKRGWLSDQDVANIRARRNQGETLERIARAYDISAQTVGRICLGKGYQEPCGDQGYDYSFANRLVTQAQVQ